jgi:hypothetical protein
MISLQSSPRFATWIIHEPPTILLPLHPTTRMPSPDGIFSNWKGIIQNEFSETISKTFEIDPTDSYVYRAESFAMTMPQIQQLLNSGDLKYKYQSHGKELDVRFTCWARTKKRHVVVLTDL